VIDIAAVFVASSAADRRLSQKYFPATGLSIIIERIEGGG